MGRFHSGQLVRTNYNTGPYIVLNVYRGTEPSFLDTINLGDKAPDSPLHNCLSCKSQMKSERSKYYLNGYDDNANNVWRYSDRIIVCEEETLLLKLSMNNLIL